MLERARFLFNITGLVPLVVCENVGLLTGPSTADLCKRP